MRKTNKKKTYKDEDILNQVIQSYLDLSNLAYGEVREMLLMKNLPPRSLVDLLGVTAGEVRQCIKQKYEIQRAQQGGDGSELKALINAIKSQI